MKYINVVVENKGKYTDIFYTYKPGNFNVRVGDRVYIPFGTKTKEGFVFQTADTCDLPDEMIKCIEGVDIDNSLTEEVIKTAAWMKQRYAITYFEAIRCFLAVGKPSKRGEEKRPYGNIEGSYTPPEKLTLEQEEALEKISSSFDKGIQQTYLIHGVTASGKTQVYMEAIAKALNRGKTAIMLVPEISLTKQVIETFAGRFGIDNIAVMHSKLTKKERYDEWQRIRQGKAKIVIGARMAVFAPISNIGIIIMDEEHEATYKSDQTPKYDTIDIVLKRAKYYNSTVVLGSATPSVVSYERAHEGIYNLIELKERYNKTPLPRVEVVDMREELKNGNTSIFSHRLYSEINNVLGKHQQVILLQNRRGYSNFVSCRQCGMVMKCPECGISLTYHKSMNAVVCHYCGRKYPVPKICPECGSKYIKFFGIGTEQVEEAVNEFFPDAKTDRLDLDAVKRRKDLNHILDNFSKGKTDILVGTQLVAKGLDFKNVGLVGVIAADVTLNIPDYRSAERTYQLITQAAGRAGRGSEQGTVIVQSYEPDSFALKAAETGDYEKFFDQEAKIRKCLEYPPFGDIIAVNFTSEDENLAVSCAERCRLYMQNAIGKKNENRVLAPKVSYNFKGADSFRYYIIVKCPKGSRNLYVYYLDNFGKILLDEQIKCNINIDVNPYSIV